MSNKDDNAANKRRERIENASYAVGYGKPPQQAQFEKGQSGNPRGRPRKLRRRTPTLSDAPMDMFLNGEAYRTIALRENGKPTELTAIQAVLRSMFSEAVKGKRLSQKYLIEFLERKEAQHLALQVRRYVRLENLKHEGEAAIAESQRKGTPLPDLLPHPDDIVLNPITCDARVYGPETRDDVHFFEHTAALRDHCMLRAAHTEKYLRRQSTGKEQKISAYMVFAHFFDACLPRRYRWKADADFALMWKYLAMDKRERERLIAEETTHLKNTEPPYIYSTPEMRNEFRRTVEQLFKINRHAS